MRFANPAGLFLAALAIPVLLLHVLKPRRQPVEVSSTYLWQSIAQPVSAATPWQRLRPSVLLFLQLLTVLLLAVAVARPARVTAAPLSEHTVFIIDASGSMAAKDGDPDRLADAKDRARDLRGELPEGGIASVVVASGHPRVVLTASPDRTAFDDAIGPIATTAGHADWGAAFTLAESLETPGADIGFVIVGDGGLTDAEQRLIPPGTTYEKTGSRATNRGIIRVAVEPRGSGLHARVTVANTGGGDATQTLRFDVDGHTVESANQDVRTGTGDVVEIEADLPAGDRVEAFLEGDDLLDADDHAYAVAARRRPLKVLVAGPEDVFLDLLLESTPGVTVDHSATSVAAPGYDLAIYDQVDVPADPQAPFFAIASPSGAPGIEVDGTVERPAVTLVQSDDPLVQGLDLSDVAIAEAQRLVPSTAEVVVGAEGAPLLLRGSLDGRPFAYLAFPLAQSNLPLQLAFPILGDRLLTDLAGAALPPGDLVVGAALPVEPGTATTIHAPGGATIEVAAGAPAPVADRPGFWTIETPDGSRPDRVVAVNADPAESSLAPAPSLLAPERQERPGERKPSGESPVLAWVVWPLLVLLVLELLAARRKVGVSRRQWRGAIVLRVLIALLLVGALLDLAVIRPADRVATMFLLDGSDSLGASGQADALAWVQEAIHRQPGGALAGVAVFGGDARLELTVQPDASLGQPAVRIDASRTNLANALRLAAAVLPADAKRRVVLVSDGRATEGDVADEAQRLRESGVQVDVHLVGRAGGADVAVASLDAPGLVREGESFNVTATITANRAGPAQLTLLRDGEVVDQRVVELPVGTTTVDIPQVASGSGLGRYQLRVSGAGDAISENDVGYAAVQVEGPAKVLVVEGGPGDGTTLAAALRAGGITVDVIGASSLPSLDELATYASTILVDVDARSLTSDQVRTLAASTRDLGHGLVTVGGTHSYGLGGYLGSELEQLLPVISEITDPKRRQSVAEVLAIDTSGSMGACHCSEGNGQNRLQGGVRKTDIARAAAARTIEALSENDEVGVLAFNTEKKWLIDLQALPSQEVVDEGLSTITPAGGTNLRLSLSSAAEELRKSHASLKHIILFSDGFTDPSALTGLADEAAALAAEGITVSVLATGEGAADQLADIAEAGQGRFYPGRDLQQIPQIMMEEAIIASRDFITEGEFFPEVVSSAEPVRNLTSSPPLLGYVATTAKPAAQAFLRIGPDHDPLLATWHVGLGKATSWTSDAAARWSQQWQTWDGYVGFWSGVVKDTFAQSGGSGVQARVEDGVLRITLEGEESFPDGATGTARVTGPDLDSQEVRLERTSGTTFEAEVPVTDAGTYAVGATVTGADGASVAAGSTLASQSYAPEYKPGEPDLAVLERVSALTGGRGSIEPEQAFDGEGLAAGRSRIGLAPWFLLAAALLWPIAVAMSRLALRGAAVRAVKRRAAWVTWSLRSLRSRLPSLPGREPRAPPAPRPAPPVRERREKETVPAAPPATIGRLLDRKRSGKDPPDE